MLERDFYDAIVAWNHHKSWNTLWQLYKKGFTGSWFGFRLWRIVRNTVNGRYKDIEKKVQNGVFKVVD